MCSKTVTMRTGEHAEGIEFYKLLYADDEFCKELGRTVLAAGRLEAELIKYMDNKNVGEKIRKATLGTLIEYTRKHELLTKIVPVLEILRDQRNYLTHNIYALFSGFIEETILPGSGLLDSDVDLFTDRVCQLTEDLNWLADVVAKEQ
jgi:hypothetical protein